MTVWTPLTTPWDFAGVQSAVYCGCFAPGFGAGTGRLVAGGYGPSGTSNIMTSDDGGVTFTDRGVIFSTGGATGFVRGLVFVPAGSVVVAVGIDQQFVQQGIIARSLDGGATWGASFEPFGPSGIRGIASNTDGSLLVAIDDAGGLWSSTDAGITWSAETSPFTGGAGGVRFIASLGKWFACASSGAEAVASAPAADVSVWTPISTPFDGFAANDAGYLRAASKLYVCQGQGTGGIIASNDGGGTWATEVSPLDFDTFTLAEAGAAMLCAGDNSTFAEDVMETDGAGTWTGETAIPDPNGGVAVWYVPELELAFLGDNASNSGANQCMASAPFTPFVPPTPAVTYTRVYGIELLLSDDGVEQVSRLVTSPDGFT